MTTKEEHYKDRCDYLTRKIVDLFHLLRDEFLVSKEELDELMVIIAKVLTDNDIA